MAGARAPSHRHRHRHGRKYHRRRRKIKGAVDLISSLHDVILQHILSFIPTEFAIKTSLLSKRWRHVWRDIPSLYFDYHELVMEDEFINKTLTRYTAPKMINFHLHPTKIYNVTNIDTWIKFAMSRNVENLSLNFVNQAAQYKIPDFFYVNSSIKQLTLDLDFYDMMIPRCSVSWTSLKKLSLRHCRLSDEFSAKILSGCPILESLTLQLHYCYSPRVLDLSKSMRLRTLEINGVFWNPKPVAMQIVAPHIHCLRFIHSHLPCTDLVDVSSLTEAKLDICIEGVLLSKEIKANFVQVMVQKMLEKLKNVEKLTFGGNFLQVLSFAELRGVPFPMFKVKSLTLETGIFRYVIPGIERVLQNSPDLKKFIVHTTVSNCKPGVYLGDYMDLEGLNLDQCWRSKYGVFWNKSCSGVKSKHVVSFVELMIKNTKTLDKMVILLEGHYLRFKELIATLSHNYNVSIALYTKPSYKS